MSEIENRNSVQIRDGEAKTVKLLLVDGHSILSRAFYGIPALTDGQGRPTNAIYGFLNILFKVLDEEKATHLAVAFDLKAPTFRHKMYAAYKGTRKPMPEELHLQVPMMQDMLRAMHVPILTKEGYEADDILGTIGKRMEASGVDVSIMSGDRDLLQLSDKGIKIILPKTANGVTTVYQYYPEDVVREWHATPEEFIDLKALMGDTSDNIPGVPGLGPKSAEWIIEKYHTIEAAHEAALSDDPDFKVPRKPKAKDMLIDSWDSAVMSKTLATICTTAPIDFSLDDADISDMLNPEAYEMIKTYGLKSLEKRFSAVPLPSGNDGSAIKLDSFKSVDDPFMAKIVFRDAAAEGEAGFFISAKTGALYMALKHDRNYCFHGFDFREALISLSKEKNFFLYTMGLKQQLKSVMFSRDSHIKDISLAAYIVNPLKDSYDYADISQDYLSVTLPSGKDITEEMNALAGGDACAAFTAVVSMLSKKTVFEKLSSLSGAWLYEQIEMPLVYTLHNMEEVGILVDKKQLTAYGEELRTGIQELEQKIYKEAGEIFNINSPKQLGEVLFVHMGLKGGKKTKSGYSTAADVLEKLAEDQPVVRDILQYRTLSKLNSTYAEGLLPFISEDGRIHGEFNQMVTATGRISSANPNLQNIPIRTELGRRFRTVFVPKEGCVFVDADYSQVELRILASLSGDQKLIEAYRHAEDIHAVTASQVFHVPLSLVTPDLRRNAKAVNFGIVYGISAFGLSEGLSISRAEAKEYIERYFQTYPDVKRYLDEQVSFAHKNGYVTTLFGRRRPVPDINAQNFMRRSFSERVAMNSPIQGTAADIMKKAMNDVDIALKDRGLKARIVVQVHDELLVEAPVEEAEMVQELLKDKMEHAAELAVSLVADAKIGSNWEEAH